MTAVQPASAQQAPAGDVAPRTCPPGPCYTAEGPGIPTESVEVASLIAPIPTLNAQQPPLPQLTVNVTDQTGAIIPGALVEITDSAGVLKTAAYTKADGSALFPITPGHDEISVRAVGFLNGQQEIDFPKTSLITLTLMISNEIECGPCVNPTPIFLETTQPVITGLVPDESLDNLPLRLKSHRILTTKEP